jgi:hypothetical protein
MFSFYRFAVWKDSVGQRLEDHEVDRVGMGQRTQLNLIDSAEAKMQKEAEGFLRRVVL